MFEVKVEDGELDIEGISVSVSSKSSSISNASIFEGNIDHFVYGKRLQVFVLSSNFAELF